jgi:uncharacterized LabA/DUF88 family protein
MTGLFVDTANLYFCVGKRYPAQRLDYQKLWNQVSGIGPIFKAFAYGFQMRSEATGFIACLAKIGFQPKYRRHEMIKEKIVKDSSWNVGLTIDIVKFAPRLSTVVLCSADPELLPTIQWIRDQQLRLHVIACGIPNEIKEVVDHWIEIPEDLLETRGVT